MRNIVRTTVRCNALTHITKTSHELQLIRSDRARCRSASDPQDTSHSPQYSFLINFLGRARQLEVIAIYDSIYKVLGSIQAHQFHIVRPFYIQMFWLSISGQLYTSPERPYWSIQFDCTIPLNLIYNLLRTSPSFERPDCFIQLDCQNFLDKSKNSFPI